MRSESLEQVLRFMDQQDQKPVDLQRYQRRMWRLHVASTCVALCVYAGLIVHTALLLLAATRSTGSWATFWDAMRLDWSLVGIAGAGSFFTEQAMSMRQARLLHTQAALHLGNAAAPQAETPPPTHTPISGDGERVGPLERIERDRRGIIAVVLALPVLLTAGICASLIGLLVSGTLATTGDIIVFSLILGIPALIFAWMAFLVARKLRAISQPLVAFADDDGLAWRSSLMNRRVMRLPWREARSFIEITEPDVSDHAFSVYIVSGQGRRLAWRMPRRPTPEQRDANARLGSLVTSYTGLSLVVVSAALLSPEDHAAPDVDVRDVYPSGSGARLLTLAWMLPFLLALLITICGVILQRV